ncbi:MAG: TonB family protein [Pseudomonadota bacterium]
MKAHEMAVERFKTQVLILHPEQSVLDACQQFFGDEYSVHLAHSGREALTTLGDTPIDFFVTAQDLPGMSGTEALNEARKRSPDTQGILLAPLNSSQQEMEALASSKVFAAVLKGNASPQEIRGIVADAARKNRLQQLQDSANDSSHPETSRVDLPKIEIEAHSAEVPAHEPMASFQFEEDDDEDDELFSINNSGELPTAGLRTAAGGASIEILVLSQDEAFGAAISHASKGDHPIHHAPTLQEATDIISTGRVGVLVTDAAVSPGDVQIITERLREIQPSLVTIVAGRRDDGDELMGLIAEGIVYRFLLKPVSPGRARLAIEASVKKSLEYQDNPPPPPSATQTTTRSTVVDYMMDDDKVSFSRIIGVLGALAIVVAVGAFWFFKGADDVSAPEPQVTQSQPATVSPPPAEAATEDGTEEAATSQPAITESDNTASVADAAAAAPVPESADTQTITAPDTEALRREAFRAMAEGRIAMPAESNALTMYANALAADPLAVGLSDEFDQSIAEALSLTENALITGQLDDAEQIINRIREVRPYQARLPFLEAQLRKERRRAIIDNARALDSAGDTDAALALLDEAAALSAVADPAVSAARESMLASQDSREISNLLSLANERMASGQLISPSDDNARFFFRAALAKEPNNAAATQGLRLIGARFIADADAAFKRGDIETASGLLDTARSSGATAADVRTLAGQIAETRKAAEEQAEAAAKIEREQEAQRAAAAEAKAQADADAAAAALAAAQPRVSDEGLQYVKLSELVRTRYVAPQFPRSAIRRDLSGWVSLEFTVSAEGKVEDISILESEPGTIFVSSATKALQRWEYEPVIEDGVAVARRASVRLQFALTD